MTLDEETAAPAAIPGDATVLSRQKRPRMWFVVLGLMLLAALLFALAPRNSNAHANSEEAAANRPVVAVVPVTREEITREVVFDSELRPYQEIDLHAKVSGFVKTIMVDVGDHAKEGQLIAELELPEVKDDLDRATSAQSHAKQQIRRAEAAWDDAHLTLNRMLQVNKAQPNLIAQQDIDTATARERHAE